MKREKPLIEYEHEYLRRVQKGKEAARHLVTQKCKGVRHSACSSASGRGSVSGGHNLEASGWMQIFPNGRDFLIVLLLAQN